MSEANKDRRPYLDANKVLHLISSEGILCRTLKGFEPRKPQQMMMRNIIDAYNKNAIALIEAGTGTGKSMAYLLPAILWALENKQRTLISTHTIALQEQLLNKDIPLITNALNLDIKAVVAKGMSNYLCLRKLDETMQELLSPEEKTEVEKVDAWAKSTRDGSKSSLPMMPSSTLWERVCAESDTCSHAKCPNYQECFFYKARAQAEEAQIIIANHHLLFADLSIRSESNNYKGQAILPAYSRIVIDEAHHIEDIATDFFGATISKMGLLRLLARIATEKQNKPQGRLLNIKEKLQQSFPNPSQGLISSLLMRFDSDLWSHRKNILNSASSTFNTINDSLDCLSNNYNTPDDLSQGENKLRFLPGHHQHTIWQSEVIPSTQKLIEFVDQYVQALTNMETDLKAVEHPQFQEYSQGARQEVAALASRLEGQADLLKKLIINSPQQDKVRWIEVKQSAHFHNVSLQDADLDVSKAMVEFLFSQFSTIILCSATLTTQRKQTSATPTDKAPKGLAEFEFFRKRLGILEESLPGRKIIESVYESPFNYFEQALLVIPTDLPEPHHASFLDQAVERIWGTIEISRGSCFVLFTSYTMMKTCYDKLADRLLSRKYSLFKQGDAERQLLLSQYKISPKAVLFGTDSFWEGIDVAGEALRCVIIVKLPFRVPTEPITQARSEAILDQGGDPFNEYSLPTAIVKFKQGFGRLIRHARDRGCIVCLDTRLITKKYGSLFLSSLPPCQQIIAPSQQLKEHMTAFYRRTQHFVKS